MLARQTSGPEFRSSVPTEKGKYRECAYNLSAWDAIAGEPGLVCQLVRVLKH